MKPRVEHRRRLVSRSGGFTLLELLITVALLSMLTVVLFGGLRFGTRAWEAAQTSADGGDKFLAAQAFLADRVSGAYPLFVRASPEDGHVEFEGNSGSVTFLAPAKSPQGALEWVTIGTQDMNGAPALAVWTALELSPGSRPRLAAVLLKKLTSFQIEYFGSDRPRDRPSWRLSWHHGLTLPTSMRIRATFADRRMIWPDLVIATHLSVDQGCKYDQLTNYVSGSDMTTCPGIAGGAREVAAQLWAEWRAELSAFLRKNSPGRWSDDREFMRLDVDGDKSRSIS